jgi:triacylglycerol lipase
VVDIGSAPDRRALVRRRAVALVVAVVGLTGLAPGAAVAQSPEAEAVRCDTDLGSRPQRPVVLVHGTGVDAEINWSWGYEQDLRRRGHGICLFDLPKEGAVDLQDSVLLTIAALRRAHAEGGGRRVAAIGHSQGASQLMLALRSRPDLGDLVDDVIGLAGVYSNGSQSIGRGCRARGCPPSFWQFSPGSKLLRALEDRPLPRGVDFTAIGTLRDTVVTPQPQANELAGARGVQIQDICPGRRFVDELDHIYLAADAVTHALALDALGNPGPADPARVDRLVCAQQTFLTIDPIGFALVGPGLLAALSADRSIHDVTTEPTLRCPLAAARCVSSSRRVRTRRGTVVRVRGTDEPVTARLVRGRTRGRSVVVPPASVRSLRVAARGTVRLEARAAGQTRWSPVRTFRTR